MDSADDSSPPLAIALAHPARLRALAARHGLTPPGLPPAFGLLELGCGEGANLLPLAARFEQARFVGVERDPEALGRARSVVERCELANVSLFAEKDFDVGAHEPFDFTIAHGIYSWVEPEAQRALLRTCRDALAADGVALVSYNTFPGWAVRGVVREMMLRSAAGADREERLVAARSTVARLARHLGRPEHPYRALLSAELDLVRRKADAELCDDELAVHNEPLYFETFIQRAAAQGLQYLAELVPASPDGALDAELAAALLQEGLDRVRAEQVLDVLCYRQLRATLLCRAEAPLRALPDDSSLLREGYFAARLEPQAEEPLLGPGRSLGFRAPSGAVIEVERPLLKASLLVLAERWPRGLAPQALITEAIAELRLRDLVSEETVTDEEIQATLSDLTALAQRRQLELLGWCPAVLEEVAERPRVHPLTRWEAERSSWITSARHDPVELDAITRAVVRLLDGTRDYRSLTTAISQRIDGGVLQPEGELPQERRGDVLAGLVMRAVITARNIGLLVAGL